jgi:hypothetical protein
LGCAIRTPLDQPRPSLFTPQPNHPPNQLCVDTHSTSQPAPNVNVPFVMDVLTPYLPAVQERLNKLGLMDLYAVIGVLMATYIGSWLVKFIHVRWVGATD